MWQRHPQSICSHMNKLQRYVLTWFSQLLSFLCHQWSGIRAANPESCTLGVCSCGEVNSLSLCLTWFYFAAACDGEVSQVTRSRELCGKCGFLLQNPFRENALGNILQKTNNLYFSVFFFSWKLIFSENYHKPEFSFWICLLGENTVEKKSYCSTGTSLQSHHLGYKKESRE